LRSISEFLTVLQSSKSSGVGSPASCKYFFGSFRLLSLVALACLLWLGWSSKGSHEIDHGAAQGLFAGMAAAMHVTDTFLASQKGLECHWVGEMARD
jgi:hypothetical protein